MRLVYRKGALKALLRMPAPVRKRMVWELERVAEAPTAYRGNWKRLQGSPYWRLRVGGYRAICALEDDELVLLVLKVGARGDEYK